jgi:PIN domain nuclease of toxin-antitoxin system
LTEVLLDTHVLAWSLQGNTAVSRFAAEAMKTADLIWVSPVSVYEIGQKVRLGKWPEMEPVAPDLPRIIEDLGASFAPVSPDILLRAASADWDHRDPFDRILGATAEALGVVFLTNDPAFERGPFKMTLAWS